MKTKYFLSLLIIISGIIFFIHLSFSGINSPDQFTEENKSTKIFKGIYVTSEWNKPVSDYVLQNNDVDGVFLRLYWNRLQPNGNKFEWSMLDAELKRITDAGKKISLGVAAGSNCPMWIYNLGVPSLNFKEFRHQGKGKLFNVKIPVPWNEKYLQLWIGFIQSLATHLKADPEIYSNITLVKLGGINESTIEIRLPSQKNMSNEKGRSTDAPTIWRSVGYRPQLIRGAWKQIVQAYCDNFNDKDLSMSVIPKRGFPSIDTTGKEVDSDYDFTEELIADANKKVNGRFVVQWNSLKENIRIPALMDFAGNSEIAKGYQLAESEFADPDCLKNNIECEEYRFMSVLIKGLDNNASFIEIFPKDVLAYPNAIADVHNKLIK